MSQPLKCIDINKPGVITPVEVQLGECKPGVITPVEVQLGECKPGVITPVEVQLGERLVKDWRSQGKGIVHYFSYRRGNKGF